MSIAATIRAEARDRLHDAVLDAAYATTVEAGWSAVRMGELAATIGVSRQTVHNAFGTKQALGRALVLRESDAFLGEVLRTLRGRADDPRAAIRDATVLALHLLPRHPLLRGALTGHDGGLLPEFTSRAGPLIAHAALILAEEVQRQRPTLDGERVRAHVDALIRLVISYSVAPEDTPDVTGRRLADLIEAGFTALTD